MPDANASEKTLLVIEAALTHSRFTRVVEATGLAKATVHRIVSTLVDSRFVTVAMDGTYLPGPKFLSLAGHALQRIDISAIARPFVDELVAKVHCTVHVGAASGYTEGDLDRFVTRAGLPQSGGTPWTGRRTSPAWRAWRRRSATTRAPSGTA